MAQAVVQPDETQTDDSASPSIANKKIEDTIQTHLDAFNVKNDDHTPDPLVLPKVDGVTPGEPTPEDDTTSDTAPVVEPVSTNEPVPAEPATTGAAASASTLPEAYIRTAKARGWTDDEIQDFAASAKQDVVLKTFERMHESRIKETQEWAAAGRKVKQTDTAPVALETPQSAGPKDYAALAELHGVDETTLRAILEPIDARFAAFEPIMQKAAASQAQVVRTQQEALGKIVRDFFASPEITRYKEAYGSDPNALTATQMALRERVLETADALITGATMQGRDLSIPDALALAHDSESSSFREQVIRDQLRKDSKQREKGITFKPTAQGRQAVGGPPRDEAELLARTVDRLQNVFG